MEEHVRERIKNVLKLKGTNPSKFSGDDTAMQKRLSRQLNGGSAITYETLSSILTEYPDISSEWLMTGNGDMEIKEEKPRKSFLNGRPYYNVDFLGGFDIVAKDNTINPEYNIDFPPYNKDGVIWCNITGRSMEPEITSGDIIAIKEILGWKNFLVMNDIYAIVTTNDLRTVKTIKKGSDSKHYLLVPSNSEFESQEIDINMISKIFKVLGCMKKL